MKNIKLQYLALAALLGISFSSQAQNSKLMLNFGGSPGDPVAHSYDYGLPEDAGQTYTMRVPVLYEDLGAVFHDTEVTVLSEGKIVQRVDAVRAYKSLNDCNLGLKVVKQKLVDGLPKPYLGDPTEGDFQSPDGKVIAKAVCEKKRRRPFFTLRLEIKLSAQ